MLVFLLNDGSLSNESILQPGRKSYKRAFMDLCLIDSFID
jgi:hypothetical protein